jgi:hypothetical protein
MQTQPQHKHPMSKYLVRCKASVYFDIEMETQEKWDAEAEGLDAFGSLLDNAPLPSPLEWDSVEVWEVEPI